jgi:hypothetical protein
VRLQIAHRAGVDVRGAERRADHRFLSGDRRGVVPGLRRGVVVDRRTEDDPVRLRAILDRVGEAA